MYKDMYKKGLVNWTLVSLQDFIDLIQYIQYLIYRKLGKRFTTSKLPVISTNLIFNQQKKNFIMRFQNYFWLYLTSRVHILTICKYTDVISNSSEDAAK